jgi:hypothetical protein
MRSISEKRLAKLGGKMPFSSIVPKPNAKPKRSKRLASEIAPSRKPVRKSNPKRKAKEFARCYHSEERVLFVQGLRCITCNPITRSVNAHICGEGASRKASYDKIVPLCFTCHGLQHAVGVRTFGAMVLASTGHSIAEHAAKTEADWQAECARRGLTTP